MQIRGTAVALAARDAALLWPGNDLGAARNTLCQRLFQLRKLVGGNDTLALSAHVAHDLEDGDRLPSAWVCPER